MAKRLNVKLQPFKFTKRSTTGGVTHHLVPRGCTSKARGCTSRQSEDSVLEPQENAPGSSPGLFHGESVQEFRHDMAADNLPTLHQVFQKQSIESWRKIRLDMLKVVIGTEALPEDKLCFVCNSEIATYRCLQCSPGLYYCSSRFESAHSRTNIFHSAEVWEVRLL